jgi:hypothetical protein
MEPSTIAAALTAGTHATTLLKNLVERIKATGKAEVLGDFIELQSAMMELQQRQQELITRIRALEDENRNLKTTADLRANMRFNGKFYEVSGLGAQDGYYCSVCYDKDGKFIRLRSYQKAGGGAGHQCQACEARFA